MEHEDAIRTLATERYSLDEMTSDERDAFEEHYFDCNECWTDVQRAEMFAQNAKIAAKFDPKPEESKPEDSNVHQFKPRSMKVLAPAAAAALLVLLGFGPVRLWIASLLPPQGEMPHLYVSEQMRGADDQSNNLPAKKWVTVEVDIVPVDGAASYRLELQGPKGTRHLDVAAEKVGNAEKEGSTVLWLLRPLPPGSYKLVTQSVDRGGKRSEIARYPIKVQVGGGS